jgi:probable phosphoglycerate mutase
MKKTFYIMRHGQTLFNVRRKIQGACDSPLTELGIRQAKGAAKYFQNIPLDHIYSSTSERASNTLEIVTDYRMPYRRFKGLKEMNFGIYEGECEDLIPDKETIESFFVKYGGESTDILLERMVNTCTRIMEQDNHGVVLAVSHAFACIHFMKAWTDPTEHINKGITNCIIFKFEYEKRKFKLVNVIRPEPIPEW